MTKPFAGLIAMAFAATCWLGPAPAAAQAAPAVAPVSAADDAAWRRDLSAWRAQREHELAAPDGWLTLIGLEWLKPGVNSFGSAADNRIQIHAQAPEHMGLLTLSGTTLQLLAPNGGFPPDLKIDGQAAREGQLSADNAKPSTIAWHGLTLLVLLRGDRYALRIKDADSPTRTGFQGLHWYAPDARFRVTAEWTPFNPPRTEHIPTVLGTTLDMPSPGVAEFKIDGVTYHLAPVVEDPSGKELFFILRDQTSATTTYPAARFLHTGVPDHGLAEPGVLTLDFNRLESPPCAYTSYATCPLPPELNRLKVALEAGEQRYH